jgi:sulfur-oxidizing protein SoxX
MMQDSFRAEGIAGLDRIQQDETQKFCSDPVFAGSKQGEKMRDKIQKINMAEIKQPSNGKYIGDWKKGEAIAQSGRGATWTDKADAAVGGGCYNCHQINPKEISYGNIGPSLTGYGKSRGYSPEVITYTWNRINNSKAYNACSNMPRFAHFKLLNEQQIQDVMALLLDPASPVNQ